MMRRGLIFSVLALIALSPAARADEVSDRQTAINTAQSFAVSRLSNLPKGSILKIRQVELDALGQGHVRLDHYFNGLPVFESEAIVHTDLKTGRMLGVTDALVDFKPVSIVPGIGAAQARQQAAAHFKHNAPLGGRDELMIIVDNSVPHLSWRVHSEGSNGRAPVDTVAFIDAGRGGVVRAWDNLHTIGSAGTGKGFFYPSVDLTTEASGSSFNLKDPSRGNQYTCDMNNGSSNCTLFYDANSDNVWGDTKLTNRQSIASDAQYGTSMTWDYYLNTFGRNGIAGDGAGAYNRVHYSSGYNNAFWSDSCFCMTYGDGDGTTFNPFDSLDVAGHEMTHGITSRSANLTYSRESGGLNEATSDIFGTVVEFYANNASDTGDYLIGEKLYKSSGKYLRSMVQPSIDGRSADCWYKTLGNLDVHYSSGVANHFFFLLAEGSSSATYGSSKICKSTDTRTASITGTVTAIGRAKAAAIWYRALTIYMTSSTNYSGARAATLKAAADLLGTGAITQNDYNAVGPAWTAVNVK